MGVLPLQFQGSENRKTLKLDGSETISITGIESLKPGTELTLTLTRSDGEKKTCTLLCRIDTENELNYFHSGGILNYVLDQIK